MILGALGHPHPPGHPPLTPTPVPAPTPPQSRHTPVGPRGCQVPCAPRHDVTRCHGNAAASLRYSVPQSRDFRRGCMAWAAGRGAGTPGVWVHGCCCMPPHGWQQPLCTGSSLPTWGMFKLLRGMALAGTGGGHRIRAILGAPTACASTLQRARAHPSPFTLCPSQRAGGMCATLFVACLVAHRWELGLCWSQWCPPHQEHGVGQGSCPHGCPLPCCTTCEQTALARNIPSAWKNKQCGGCWLLPTPGVGGTGWGTGHSHHPGAMLQPGG